MTVIAGLVGASTLYYNVNAEPVAASSQIQVTQGLHVKPITVVNSPKTYLNKTIIMDAKFFDEIKASEEVFNSKKGGE